MHVKNLAIQRREFCRIIFPITVPAKKRMGQRQADQRAADDAKMDGKISHE
jgi:hypothetical protein